MVVFGVSAAREHMSLEINMSCLSAAGRNALLSHSKLLNGMDWVVSGVSAAWERSPHEKAGYLTGQSWSTITCKLHLVREPEKPLHKA